LARKLMNAGVRNVRPLAGGFDAWKDTGLPLERLN
jgi:rhodanese-related sulfurtransferase